MVDEAGNGFVPKEELVPVGETSSDQAEQKETSEAIRAAKDRLSEALGARKSPEEIETIFEESVEQFPELGDDESFVYLGVRSTGNNDLLQKASPRLRDSSAFMCRIMNNNSSALRYASDRLRDDFNTVWFAIFEGGNVQDAFQYMSPRLREKIQSFPDPWSN